MPTFKAPEELVLSEFEEKENPSEELRIDIGDAEDDFQQSFMEKTVSSVVENDNFLRRMPSEIV